MELFYLFKKFFQEEEEEEEVSMISFLGDDNSSVLIHPVYHGDAHCSFSCLL
jgi:hypothetical protein